MKLKIELVSLGECKKCIDYDFKPPIMICPICKTEYQDFDGLGIIYCNNCGYCIHASSTFDEALNVYICDYCGKVQK